MMPAFIAWMSSPVPVVDQYGRHRGPGDFYLVLTGANVSMIT